MVQSKLCPGGGAHPAEQIPLPSAPPLRKRLRQKTTVPEYDAFSSPISHVAEALTVAGTKRSLDDQSLPPAKHQQCNEDSSPETFEIKYWYLSDTDKQIWKFVDAYGRKPKRRTTNNEEKQLALYIKNHISQLHEETQTKLRDLDDPAECAAFAKLRLEKLREHKCSPSMDLMRVLKVIQHVPNPQVIAEERFEQVQEEAHDKRRTKRHTERWRNSGIQLQRKVPADLNNGSAEYERIPLPWMQYCLMHAVHEEVNDLLIGNSNPAQTKRRIFVDFFAGCRSTEQRRFEPFTTSPHELTGCGQYTTWQCWRLLALIELVDTPFWKLPHDHGTLALKVQSQRQQEQCDCEVLSEMLEAAVQRLVVYSEDPEWAYARAQFLKLKGTDVARREQLKRMVHRLAAAFQKENVDAAVFKPHHFASLSVYHALFLRKGDTRPRNGLRRWCCGLRGFVAGEQIENKAERQEHLASQCLPRHYDDSGVAQPAGLNVAGRAIASAPVTCELCHVGVAGHDKLKSHCQRKHCGFAEYRKRVFYKARRAGPCELQPWVKRSMVQGFQFFRLHSVPASCNDYTSKATQHAKAEPRREEACAVCAVKDWLENRYPVHLFNAGTRTTTWLKFFYATVEDDDGCDDQKPTAGTLLVDDNNIFCLGPREKVDALLAVKHYISQWPLIPAAELHASSVQHPDDPSMRWLLHSRRVPMIPHGDVAQLAEPGALPPCAGIGQKDATVWCCKLCVENLCTENPKMPPLALANSFFGGRHHPKFREASLATRMLASSARLIMRQLFLGRGADDEVHKNPFC